MNVEKFRDFMVFMMTSITKMLVTARWSVFLCESTIEKLKEKYAGVSKMDAALCGYSIDYHMDNDCVRQIDIVPALLDGKITLFVIAGEKTELVNYDMNDEHITMVSVHEKIKTFTK